MITCASAGDTRRFRWRTFGGGSFTCLSAISTADPPENGTSPVSIS
jgi:hypothetical protein